MKSSPVGLAACTGCCLLIGFLAETARGAAVARMPLLMPDDFASLQTVAWRIEPAVPDPANPLLEGDMPWMAGGIMTHGTVLRDPLDGRWKAWLCCTPAEKRIDVVTKTLQGEEQLKPFSAEDA